MTNIEDYMKDKEFFKWNPFLKGYIYDEERKKPIQWSNDNFHFFCKHADLSDAQNSNHSRSIRLFLLRKQAIHHRDKATANIRSRTECPQANYIR